jgi:hypothetical protein
MNCGRPGLAVDEPHVVAFAPPTGGKSLDIQDDSHQLASANRVEKNVVVVAAGMQPVRDLSGNGLGRIFAAPAGVKTAFTVDHGR